jgi:hypothetical protein
MALVNGRRLGLAQALSKLLSSDTAHRSADLFRQSISAGHLRAELTHLQIGHKRLHGLHYGFGLFAVG